MSGMIGGEILSFFLVLSNQFMGVVVTESVEDSSTSGISLQPRKDTDQSLMTENLLDVSTQPSYLGSKSEDINLKEKIASKPNALGEIYKCCYQEQEMAYRKIDFVRISGYVLEGINEEIESIRKMNSKFVVEIASLNNQNPTIGIITQHYPNGSLYNLLHNQNIILKPNEYIRFISSLAQGLRECHANNRFHGHLSSHNILLDDDNMPRISDIGIAKIKKYAGVVLGYSNKSA